MRNGRPFRCPTANWQDVTASRSVRGRKHRGWIVVLDRTIEYQLKVGEPYQFRLIQSGELVIGTREQNRAIGATESTAVHILLPLRPDATKGSDLRVREFYTAAWGVCRREDAV